MEVARYFIAISRRVDQPRQLLQRGRNQDEPGNSACAEWCEQHQDQNVGA